MADLEVEAGERFELGSPTEGMWSYLAIGGGVDAPMVMGSRSTNVREGIGGWLQARGYFGVPPGGGRGARSPGAYRP